MSGRHSYRELTKGFAPPAYRRNEEGDVGGDFAGEPARGLQAGAAG